MSLDSMAEFDMKTAPEAKAGSLRRLTLAALGVFFVGVGWIGVFLPGIPTVGPLLLASFLFTKSCPVLERVLILNRFFAPYLVYLDGQCEMPLRARVWAMIMMWGSIGFSCWMLTSLPPTTRLWSWVAVVSAGLIGSWFIMRYGRQRASVARAPV